MYVYRYTRDPQDTLEGTSYGRGKKKKNCLKKILTIVLHYIIFIVPIQTVRLYHST